MPLNVARQRRPRRFNPPLKKDATSSQTSATEDNLSTTVLPVATVRSTHAEEREAARTQTNIHYSLTKSSRYASKSIQPPQNVVQSSRKGRKHGKKGVFGDSCLPEERKDGDDQEVATRDTTSTSRQANKRAKKSDPFHIVEKRQMDFTSAEVNSTAVPKDFGNPIFESKEEMKESQHVEVEQVEQSQRIHTVLSYCDESHHEGGNVHFGSPMGMNELEQEECIHPGESGKDMEDSIVSDVVTYDTSLYEHNGPPYPYCGGLDSNLNYHFLPSDQDRRATEHDHDQIADLCRHSPESESDSETTVIPRRQFRVPSTRPCMYNFSVLPPKLNIKGITSRRKLSTRQKRVTVNENHNTSIPLKQVRERNVFDFQPSQESTRDTDVGDIDIGKRERQGGRSMLDQSRSALDVSYSRRTREEQVSSQHRCGTTEDTYLTGTCIFKQY